MRPIDLQFMREVFLSCMMPRPSQRPSEWCVENLEFDEATNHGPFRLDGSEYMIDVLDDWADTTINDEVLVFGSQSHKTGSMMGGLCWALKNDPCGVLWVMPNRDLARKFSTQRFSRMIRKSKGTSALVPTGAKRYDASALAMMLGSSTINIVGSNSDANLSSNPCRRVIMDEVEKFSEFVVSMAQQRTKDQVDPQRWKTSSPELESGPIWQEFLKGDQRRYFVPCPSCFKDVVFAWSKQYTIFPIHGYEAFITWDSNAKVDGKWDYDAVAKTAHATCPHCQARIEDGQKKAMVKQGRWIATNQSAPRHFVSRHLPSLYCSSSQTSFGTLAVKFIQECESASGPKEFITGDLAEPYASQDLSTERVELIRKAQIEITAEWKKLLTVDAQQRWPYFWYVVRAWNGGDSEGIECGHCDTIDELRAIQIRETIPDVGVIIDSGFGSKREAEIYRHCAQFGKVQARKRGLSPLFVGWVPSKGMPSKKRWKDPASGQYVPWYLRPLDPLLGTTEAGRMEMSLLEFAAQYYEDILANLRRGQGGYKWAVSPQMDKYIAEDKSTYWRHMDGHIKVVVESKKTGATYEEYRPRGRKWPDHLLDCEKGSVMGANFYEWFRIPTERKAA